MAGQKLLFMITANSFDQNN